MVLARGSCTSRIACGSWLWACTCAGTSGASLPAFFAFSPEDSVVDPAAIERIAARWGGPTEVHEVTLGPDDDPSRHVIAGDILSPGMTDAMVGWLAGWIRRLEQQPDDDQREAEGGGAD